jgi:integrase
MGDMTPDKGVFKRKGSDVWQHRVFIPKDVRKFYGGKSELAAKSLGTRDLKEANRLARQISGRYEAEFAERRVSTDGSAPTSQNGTGSTVQKPLTTPDADQLIARYRHTLVDRDFSERADVLARAEADPLAFWKCKILPRPQDQNIFKGRPYSYWDRLSEDEETPLREAVIYALHAQRQSRAKALTEQLQLGQTARFDEEARLLLKGYALAEHERRAFVRRLMQAELAILNDLINEQVGEPALVPDIEPTPVAASENPLLSVAAAAWIQEKLTLDLTPRRIEECHAAVALFIDIAGDRSVAKYRKSDVRDFKDILLQLPPNRNKNCATKGLAARAAAIKAQELKLTPMTVKTANNKYIAPLRNFFGHALGSYDGISTNPFEKAALPERNTPRTEWEPFTNDALKTFFNAPLYRGCQSAKQWMVPVLVVPRESARFWVPLLLLYTGARVNEICKLRVKDIGEQEGIHFFSIEWEDDGDEAGRIAGRVKNAASHRRVPIHGDLISFGFLAFVAGVRAAGYERLFHALKPNRYGKLYGTISQRFSDTFLPRLGIKTAKTSLKSFRHNFVDAARNSRIPGDIIRALKGDTMPGTLSRYGHGKTDLEILNEELAKLRFGSLDLKHLQLA